MGDGVYLKNVNTGETAFIRYDDPKYHDPNWRGSKVGRLNIRNQLTGELRVVDVDDPIRQDPNWQSIYKGCNDHVPDKVCPHCGTVCKHGKGYTRWHGENCRHKPK